MTSLAIIIPVLDEAPSVAAMLAQLAPLRARGAQIIVVDGGSRDSTCEYARPLADLLIVAPRGRATQMNAGARTTSADVLIFLHADTRLPENADEAIEKVIAGGALWGRFDVRISGRSRWLPIIASFMNHRSRLTGIATGDQAIFVKRILFETMGGFADIPLMEDIDISSRLRRLARPACLTDKVTTSGRRWDTRGAWHTIFLMWGLRLRYFFGADPGKLAIKYGYAPCPSTSHSNTH